ncbi:hypothetical protein ACLI09_00985 [Flavobacterium sp. RHBU_24]|uniref:hypothetical protein n=1 Tax=Flavobacterium sp. RHBU_24 TaxID=3391185 RepID=UPI00398537BB
MKKAYKIGCIGLIAFFVIGFFLSKAVETHDGPRQSIKFLNTSKTTKSVTFEMRDKNGTIDTTTYYVDEFIKPGESLIERIPEGNYVIKVWNADNSLHDKTDFVCKLPVPGENCYDLYRFDLAMDKLYVITCLNYVYEGGDFATHMSNAMGTHYDNLKLEKGYSGKAPFMVSENYTGRTFVDVEDKLPSSKKYGQIVYGLFYIPDTLDSDQALARLNEKIEAKLAE